jgi:hypothetical protein
MREWIVEHAFAAYKVLLPIAWIGFALVVVVLLPLAAWRRTRMWAGLGLYLMSFLFGATTWFLGAAVTFAAFGWAGLIIGLVVLGFGVVPIGIAGAFFKSTVPSGLGVILLILTAVTLISRFAGAYFVSANSHSD